MNAKLSPVSIPAVDAPWFHYWVDHPTITFQRVFAEGGKNFERPDRSPGVFRLVPRLGNKREVVGFSVQPRDGELPISWRGVTLVPMGTESITPVGTLPIWSESQRKTYDEGLSALVTAMHAPSTRLHRLEGYFPVTDDATGSFNVDRVRILLIPQIVEARDPLALVVLTLLESLGMSSRQNGGGSGPPDAGGG